MYGLSSLFDLKLSDRSAPSISQRLGRTSISSSEK